MKILNLFAGLGGNRWFWEDVQVTAIERDPVIAQLYSRRFPEDKVLVVDVFDYLRIKTIDLNTYDLIWASPPCQTHSQMQKFNPNKHYRPPIPQMQDIYGLLFWLQQKTMIPLLMITTASVNTARLQTPVNLSIRIMIVGVIVRSKLMNASSSLINRMNLLIIRNPN